MAGDSGALLEEVSDGTQMGFGVGCLPNMAMRWTSRAGDFERERMWWWWWW
jgi:hypothetical protein